MALPQSNSSELLSGSSSLEAVHAQLSHCVLPDGVGLAALVLQILTLLIETAIVVEIIPVSLRATVLSPRQLCKPPHVQQGGHDKNTVCSARVGQLHLVLDLSCILQDYDYNVVRLLWSCLELRQVLTTAIDSGQELKCK